MNKHDVNAPHATEHAEIDLSALVNEFILNKWLILVVVLSTLALGAVYAYFQTSRYEADVLLQVESGKQMPGKGGLVEQFALGGMGASSAQTQMALLKSRVVLEPVIQKLHLNIQVKKKYRFKGESLLHRGQVNKKEIVVDLFNVPNQDLNKAYMLRVDNAQQVSLLNNKGQLIVQGMVGKKLSNDAYNIDLRVHAIHCAPGTQFSVSKRSTASVMQYLLKNLNTQEVGAKGAQSGTGILNIKLVGDDPDLVVAILNQVAWSAQEQDATKRAGDASLKLGFLLKQLPITKKQLSTAEYNLNQYRAKSGKIDFKLQTQALLMHFTEVDKQLSKLHIKQLNMRQRYTNAHPMQIAINQQIRLLEEQRHQLELVLKKLPASDQIAVNLLRDVEVTKALYMILLQKIQELEVIKAGTVSNLHILSLAKMPEEPLPRKTSLILVGCLFLGLLLSALIIVSHRMFSSKIEDPDWSEQQCNIPNLATIPFCKEQKIYNLQAKNHLALVAHAFPKSLSIEALRSLRTSLQVSLFGAKNNIVSLLGIAPCVGKSFISSNLAYLLASSGKKVLLIDSDLRKGTIHKYMHLPSGPGLSEVLQGAVSIENALYTTRHDNLACMPRGGHPEDPSELLMGSQFKQLLEKMSKEYDIVLVDTAPILLVTDGVIVSSLAGTNYLILGSGLHQPAEVELALKRIYHSGGIVQGTIFNYMTSAVKRVKTNKYVHHQKYASYYYDDNELIKK